MSLTDAVNAVGSLGTLLVSILALGPSIAAYFTEKWWPISLLLEEGQWHPQATAPRPKGRMLVLYITNNTDRPKRIHSSVLTGVGSITVEIEKSGDGGLDLAPYEVRHVQLLTPTQDKVGVIIWIVRPRGRAFEASVKPAEPPEQDRAEPDQ